VGVSTVSGAGAVISGAVGNFVSVATLGAFCVGAFVFRQHPRGPSVPISLALGLRRLDDACITKLYKICVAVSPRARRYANKRAIWCGIGG
jgi:hypothetical protein